MFEDYTKEDMGRPMGTPAEIYFTGVEIKPMAKMERLTIYKDGWVTYKWVLKENADEV